MYEIFRIICRTFSISLKNYHLTNMHGYNVITEILFSVINL